MANKMRDSDILAQQIVAGMQDVKAKDIVVLNLENSKGGVADYFVICHGTSDTHVDAIAQSIDKQVRKNLKEKPWHKEGYTNRQWILLDYVNVVVHVFKEEKRAFYGIEELWGDAEFTHFENVV